MTNLRVSKFYSESVGPQIARRGSADSLAVPIKAFKAISTRGFLAFLIVATIACISLPGTLLAAGATMTLAFEAQSVLPPQILSPGYTKIETPDVLLNFGEGYSGDTSEFIAPGLGALQFNANVSIDAGGQDCGAYILSLYLNGNEVRRLSRMEGGSQFQLSGSGLILLNPADSVDIRVFHNCGSAVVVEGAGGAFFNGGFFTP